MGNCIGLPEKVRSTGPDQRAPGNAATQTIESSAEATPQATTVPTKTSDDSNAPSKPGDDDKSSLKPKFVYDEYNRRFHNIENAAYPLPNDDGEVFRLQEFHYLTRWALDGDFHPPIKELLERGAKVLDVGCGPGTWALSMASEFPNSHFTGIDIASTAPETIRPPNCEFQEVNAINGLPFPDNHFDFVYQRYLTTAYTADNWTFVLSEIKRVTKPGGWVELIEPNGMSKKLGPLFTDLAGFMIETMKTKGVDMTVGDRLSYLVERCSDDPKPTMKVDFRSIPINWGGRMGEMWANQLRLAFEALQSFFELKYGKMSTEEFKAFIDRILQESADNESYTDFYYGYVQVVKA